MINLHIVKGIKGTELYSSKEFTEDEAKEDYLNEHGYCCDGSFEFRGDAISLDCLIQIAKED